MSRLETFIAEARAGRVDYEETISLIKALFRVVPCSFRVGKGHFMVTNAAGTHVGSLSILALGRLLGLDKTTTLQLFGRHYREVLANPHGEGHANIRQFMLHGWDGVEILGDPLQAMDPEMIAAARNELALLPYTL